MCIIIFKVYSNCSCIARNVTLDASEPDATRGACDADCATANITYPFMFVLVFVTLMLTVPGANVTMR